MWFLPIEPIEPIETYGRLWKPGKKFRIDEQEMEAAENSEDQKPRRPKTHQPRRIKSQESAHRRSHHESIHTENRTATVNPTPKSSFRRVPFECQKRETVTGRWRIKGIAYQEDRPVRSDRRWLVGDDCTYPGLEKASGGRIGCHPIARCREGEANRAPLRGHERLHHHGRSAGDRGS